MKWSITADHVGISVANMEESITWYTEHLGCNLITEEEYPEISAKIAFLQFQDFRIELFEHYRTKPIQEYRKHPLTDMEHQGTLHICFKMEEGLEEMFKSFEENGVTIVMGPLLSPPKDALMGFINDNTGNLIEFIQPLKNIEL